MLQPRIMASSLQEYVLHLNLISLVHNDSKADMREYGNEMSNSVQSTEMLIYERLLPSEEEI
jgi:hypothetical protein